MEKLKKGQSELAVESFNNYIENMLSGTEEDMEAKKATLTKEAEERITKGMRIYSHEQFIKKDLKYLNYLITIMGNRYLSEKIREEVASVIESVAVYSSDNDRYKRDKIVQLMEEELL